MTAQALILAVAVGAAAIALWLDTRFAAKSPTSIFRALAHAGSALVVLNILPTLLHLVVSGSQSPVRKMVGVFGFVLPTLTYVWLSSIWVMKFVQRGARAR